MATSNTTPTEFSMEDLPVNTISGTAQRRSIVHMKITATAGVEVGLRNYDPTIENIRGTLYASEAGSAHPGMGTTYPVFYVGTAAFANAGVWDCGFIVTHN